MKDFAELRTNMVDSQVRPSDVRNYPVIDAMLDIPRERFVPDEYRSVAYVGEEIPLGEGRVLLEPRTIAKMLDLADVAPHELVLDVAAGYGYTAALLSRMAEAVVALEDSPERAEEAQAQLAEIGADNVVVETGELAAGAPEHAPFDVILIEGGVGELPQAIADQLKEGGRIVALFMDEKLGMVKLGVKINGRIAWRFGFNDGAPVLPGFERKEGFRL